MASTGLFLSGLPRNDPQVARLSAARRIRETETTVQNERGLECGGEKGGKREEKKREKGGKKVFLLLFFFFSELFFFVIFF